MYEPIVLRKRQPRTIAGTPAAKVFTIIHLIKIMIPFAGVVWISQYILKKKALIAELDEFDVFNRKLTLQEEYLLHEKFWSQPQLQHINTTVYQYFKDNNQLSEVGPGMISLSEFLKENE